MRTLIVGSVSDRYAWNSLIKENRQSPCDVIELRIDTLPQDISIDTLLSFDYKKPVIVTVRHKDEGGMFGGTEEERLAIIRQLLPVCQMIDIEISHLTKDIVDVIHNAGKKLIGSYHNFEHTPSADALLAIKERADALGVDVVKFATHIRQEADIETLQVLLIDNTVAVMGMGQKSLESRLHFASLGSALTYGVYRCSASRPRGLVTDFILKKKIQ